ncbi:MAG: PDDEXK nuclease domain-containing protein [Candidatus Cloacimonetes bacterium]|nr:PDDEXK nuclease domain-containing protein [Candidatus Cloacimonadota bacterium]
MRQDKEYLQWLTSLKDRIRQSQIKASIRINTELLFLYWELGKDIVTKQMESTWGSSFLEQLSRDLKLEFPDMSGFSARNLFYIKQFYLFYNQDNELLQQVVAEIPNQVNNCLQQYDNKDFIKSQQVVALLETHPIFQIPWGHHILIFTKVKSINEAMFYIQKTIENGWSRSVLMNYMDTDLFRTQGKALTNFTRLLPEPQSDLAQEILKNPYNFDFITLTEGYKEKELEDALTTNITKFLLELGNGFAYIGRQIAVKIGESERFIDLLFYHLELRCYVVIELKAGKFEAEHIGKLGLYISAINHQKKKETDNPTIGLIICKNKDNIEVQYSLESMNLPMGISEYQYSKLLPENLKSSLPSIEDIETELSKIDLKS